MTTSTFSCSIVPSNPALALGLEIWIDQVCVFDQEHVSEPYQVTHDLDDADGEHSLRITLKNKLPLHTKIDELEQIVSDAMITVGNIAFDEIDCTQIVNEQAVYRHNLNGTGPEIQDRFFADLGCNGTVEMKFATPIYLWLLENM
jgi:hypothetical protein